MRFYLRDTAPGLASICEGMAWTYSKIADFPQLF